MKSGYLILRNIIVKNLMVTTTLEYLNELGEQTGLEFSIS